MLVNKKRLSALLLTFSWIIPLALSAFTHLWNATGFPDIFYDEGIYVRRALQIQEGLGPQNSTFHDHPFFGQYFLAAVFSVIGFPSSLHSGIDVYSMEILYLAPRIVMGLLAVVDTFLIYKITENQYKNRTIAIAASTLFAVMPITWFLRRILLDSILTPFLLSSILFAVYTRDSSRDKNRYISVIVSGISLGLAIFTKIPAFTMTPLIGLVIITNSGNTNNKNNKIKSSIKLLVIWFIPVILIPLLWPLQAISDGQFNKWLQDVLWQTQRQGDGYGSIIKYFYQFDPVLLLLGLAGIGYAALRRDLFIVLWAVPFMVFLLMLGYVQYFYLIPILPVICIASGKLIYDASAKVTKIIAKITKESPNLSLLLSPYAVITAIGMFGIVSTTMIITTTHISSQFEAMSFVAQLLTANNNNDDIIVTRGNKTITTTTTLISSPVYSWVFGDVLHMKNVLSDYRDLLYHPIQTPHIMIIADPHFKWNLNAGKQIQIAYNSTKTIKNFISNIDSYDHEHYPYSNLIVNYEGSRIEIRVGQTDKQLKNTG